MNKEVYSKLEEGSKAAKGCAGMVAIGLVLGFVFWVGGCFDSEPEINRPAEAYKETMSSKKMTAYIKSQTCVEAKLKSPGNADFPLMETDSIPSINDTTFVVVSYVDAQNSFGALLRAYYRCVVVVSDSGSAYCLTTELEEAK